MAKYPLWFEHEVAVFETKGHVELSEALKAVNEKLVCLDVDASDVISMEKHIHHSPIRYHQGDPFAVDVYFEVFYRKRI